MKMKHAPRIATRRAQRGVMLMLLILLFAIPVIFGAYLGFVLKPGLDLVQNRMTQHQADYAALSLRWECQKIPDCSTLDENSGTANPQDWPAPYAHTPDSVYERIALSVLQFFTLSGTAHAQDGDCQPPDCLSGTKEIRDEGGKKKVYIRFKSDRDIRKSEFNAAAEATMEAGVSDFEPPVIDGAIFNGFVGCESVDIGGNSDIVGNIYTIDDDAVPEIIGDSVTIDDDDVFILEGDFQTELETEEALEIPNSLIVLGDLRARQDMQIGGDLKVGGVLDITSHVDQVNVGRVTEYVGGCIDHDEALICADADQVSNITTIDGEIIEPIGCDPIANNEDGNEGSWEGIDDFFDFYSEIANATDYSDIDDFSDINGGYFKFESIDLESDLTVTGDTVLHVEGYFSLAENYTLSVQDGASLTLMVEGNFTLEGEISGDTLVNEDGQSRKRPQVAILSKGENDVDLAGNGNLEGIIYAPESDVTISGTQSVTGSVRGKTLDINSASGTEPIKYDDELKGVETIGSFTNISTKPFLVK